MLFPGKGKSVSNSPSDLAMHTSPAKIKNVIIFIFDSQ